MQRKLALWVPLVLILHPPPKRKVGCGEYSTASHHGLAFAMDSAKSKVACWVLVNKCTN